MYADRILPSNGGVVVQLDGDCVDGAAHFHGTVLLVGGGVPWLKVGNRVMFLADRATSIETHAANLPLQAGNNALHRTHVYVVDQRDVSAVLFMGDVSE